MAQAPIMPVFAADLISDTTHLSAEEFGVYVLLLAATWLNNGKLLDDDKRLALIARIGIRKWRLKMRPALAPLFNISGGLWRQQRLEKEWNRVNATLTSRRTSAQRAGNASATRRQPPIPIPIKEASLPLKESESRSDSESEAAREGKKNQSMNPEEARCARLGGSFGGRCHPEPGPDAVPVSHRTARPRSPPCRKSPALKAKIRDQLVQKHARYLMARKRPEALAAYWTAQLGDDPAEAQRCFDAVDRLMRVERWDDEREIAA